MAAGRRTTCASRRSGWARAISTARCRCASGLAPGDRVVVYSEKALTTRSRIHVVERLPGASHDQPGRARHPALLGQVRVHRYRPGAADRRDADHGRRLPRHGRRRQGAARQQRRRPVGGAEGHAGPVRRIVQPARRRVARHARRCPAWRARPMSPTSRCRCATATGTCAPWWSVSSAARRTARLAAATWSPDGRSRAATTRRWPTSRPASSSATASASAAITTPWSA